MPTAPSGVKCGRHDDQDGHAECEVRQVEQRRSHALEKRGLGGDAEPEQQVAQTVGGGQVANGGRQPSGDLRIRESRNEPYAQRR